MNQRWGRGKAARMTLAGRSIDLGATLRRPYRPVLIKKAMVSEERPAGRCSPGSVPGAGGIQLSHHRYFEIQITSRTVLGEVAERLGTRDGQHQRRPLKQPGQSQLGPGMTCELAQLVEGTARGSQLAGGQGIPRDETDLLGPAQVKHRLTRPVGQVVEVWTVVIVANRCASRSCATVTSEIPI